MFLRKREFKWSFKGIQQHFGKQLHCHLILDASHSHECVCWDVSILHGAIIPRVA